MIEIIYNNNGRKDNSVIVKPPKNIRQIGSPRGRHKIYIEDYVYTYLHSALFEGTSEKRAAVLLGKSEVAQDIRYSFISGAISCEDFVFQQNEIIFDESCWEYIYKEIKHYFDQQEVIGWFVGMPGFSLEITPAIESAHRKYFTGREKIVFLSEPAEREDVFYTYDQGHLQKKEGYYIYYEKNLPMQEYMVSTREKAREPNPGIEDRLLLGTTELETAGVRKDLGKKIKQGSIMLESYKVEKIDEEKLENELEQTDKMEEDTQEKPVIAGIEAEQEKSAAEEALQSYRAMLNEKKENTSQKKMSVLLYTASSVVLVVLCVIGITTLNNYEKMKNVEATLSLLSDTVDDDQTQVAKGDDEQDSLVVETISGDVKAQEDSVKEEADQNNTANEKEEGDKGEQNEEASELKTDEANVDSTNEADDKPKDEKEADEVVQNPTETDSEEVNTEQEQHETVETLAQTYLQQGYYVVQAGDKLETICKNIYQTTAMLDKLCEANGIEDVDKIFAGQKLVLP